MVLLTEIASVKIVSSIDRTYLSFFFGREISGNPLPTGDGIKKTSLGSLFGNQGWFGWKG
jgi:hypothetical protein